MRWRRVWSGKCGIRRTECVAHRGGQHSLINERRNRSNFQLIIITHDETFLRKLGHGDVMEYYW